METFWLQAANIFFYVFHLALIIFNVFGWIWKKTRKWNLLTLGATAFSWFVLGIFHGWGYCFLTDWHFDVRDRLGLVTESDWYIHWLITSATGIKVSEELVMWLTVVFFFAAITISLILNIRDWLRKSRKP